METFLTNERKKDARKIFCFFSFQGRRAQTTEVKTVHWKVGEKPKANDDDDDDNDDDDNDD